MTVQVNINLVFTEDDFEKLSFEKQGDIIEGMLSHSDWGVEILNIEMKGCDEEEGEVGVFLGWCGDCECKEYSDCYRDI